MGIEVFFSDTVKTVFAGVMATLFVLSQAARKYPQVEWLQKFYLPDLRTEEQKRRARRSANSIVGVEMIGAGLAIPLVYIIAKLMFFNPITTGGMLVVGALSLLCIALGITTIVKSRSW